MRCVACEEPITNPLCPACLQEAVQQWLQERGEEELSERLEELTRRVFANSGETFCVRCSNCMTLCAYCYTKEAFGLIRDRPDLVPEYLAFFSFDLEHQGWERETSISLNR